MEAVGGRLLGTAVAAVGVALVAAPLRVARALDSRTVVADPRILRVLGARQVVQGILTAAVPTPPVLFGGAAVDVAHGLSMVGLAVVHRRVRRLALTSA